MAVKNSLVAQSKKQVFGAYLTQDAIKNRIAQVVGGKDGQRFITSIVSAVTVNPALAECDHGSILAAALLGESLKLSPSPQLGQYYIVPFEDRKRERIVATFQLGYKGYIQLAIRSGYYKKLNVLPIKEGELVKYDPLSEEIFVEMIEDEEERENRETIGYYAMFRYHNGFEKTLYWSRKKMEAHALKYSEGYKADKRKGTAYTFWSKDFDGMACKTMLRQLISKWGIMSIELQTAMESDMAAISDGGNAEFYVDNEIETPAAAEVLDDASEDGAGDAESEEAREDGAAKKRKVKSAAKASEEVPSDEDLFAGTPFEEEPF
jgi:recombination protein RecT